MSGNERLRAAISHAGLDAQTLGDLVGVDAKTIERWTSGRVPHPRNRKKIAHALSTTPSELWPDQHPPPAPEPSSRESREELVGTYIGAGDPDLPDPRELLDQATTSIDILGLSLTGLIDADTTTRLCDRASAGVRVRVLVADPESVHLLTEHSERHRAISVATPAPVVWEIERTLGYLQPLLGHERTGARLFTAGRPNAILRADDQMLVALHLFSASNDHEPILQLQRRHTTGLFARFVHHFELVWAHASIPAPLDDALYPDPDRDPARYQPDPPGATTLRAHAFGATYLPEEEEEGEVSSTPSTAPRSRRRRLR